MMLGAMKYTIIAVLLLLSLAGGFVLGFAFSAQRKEVTIRFGDRLVNKTPEDVDRLFERLRRNEEAFNKALGSR
jgi:hypothetical protein